jgi:two-component system sensor histidine kinase VicK
MRSLWIFILLVILLLAADYFFISWSWLVKLVVFLLLGALIFWNNLRVIRSNEEIEIAFGRLNEIVANLSDAVIGYDQDFKIFIVNNEAEKLFHIKKEEIIGQSFGPERVREAKFKLLTQSLFPSLAPLVIKRSEGDQYPQIVDVAFNNPDLDLRIVTIKLSLADGRTGGFVKIIHDRTRELQLYRSKSEFITVAAHQLRTPLTGISWTFETMLKDQSLSPENKEMVKNGMIASAKALKIVNDLLDVAKIEEGRFGYDFENIDIVKFVSEILNNAAIYAKQYNLKLYFDCQDSGPIILKADPNRLGLALSNVLDNAIRYNVENGSITVKLKRLTGEPYVQISVADTGVGIPPEDMPKVFTKFFRAENAIKFRPEGSGFGLYIAKNVINRHGGKIWLESTLGRGTTVYLTLPTDPNLIPPKEVVYENY